MPTPKRSREVEFAVRYTNQMESTLNAHNAIWRAQDLLANLIKLDALPGMPRGLFRPAILSYYSVGFVTCLEWHARARTADFFSFSPNSISARDFKNVGSDRLAEAASEGTTVPKLLAAMISVGSLEDYLAPFQRLFQHFNFELPPESLLSKISVPNVMGDEIVDARPRLQELFTFRHHLVHEIDWSIVGPPSKANWDFETAEAIGYIVVGSMWAIEEMIAAHAPPLFPGKLGNDALPVTEEKALEAEIQRVEVEITALIKERGLEEYWHGVIKISKAVRLYEEEFIAQAWPPDENILIDERPKLRAKFLAGRLDYLRTLRSNLETA